VGDDLIVVPSLARARMAIRQALVNNLPHTRVRMTNLLSHQAAEKKRKRERTVCLVAQRLSGR
jgi:hypothetical protein